MNDYIQYPSRKELYGLMTLMGALASVGSLNNNQGREYNPEREKAVKKAIPAGCKEYYFYGVTVVAISEKSAIKKCLRLSKKQSI